MRDNIDTIDHYPDDRVIQKTNWHSIYQNADVEPGAPIQRCCSVGVPADNTGVEPSFTWLHEPSMDFER